MALERAIFSKRKEKDETKKKIKTKTTRKVIRDGIVKDSVEISLKHNFLYRLAVFDIVKVDI